MRYKSENQKILYEISVGYRDIINTVLEGDGYPKYPYDEEKYESHKDSSIFGILAEGVYDYFETLAMAKGHDDFIRHYAISIWLDIFGVRSSLITRNQEEVGKRLLFHIKEKVNQNLDHEQKGYPAITKLLLSLHGIYESDINDEDCISSTFRKQFLEMIKDKFPLLYRTDKDFAMDMLPESYIYEQKSNKIIHKNIRGQTTELILNDTTK